MLVILLAWVGGCRSQYVGDCEVARDHLIELRFAPALHDADQVWRLLVEQGGADNVDRRALKAALKRPHDEAWYEALRDRQRFSPQMRTWVSSCVERRSHEYAGCVAGASSETSATECATH